MRAWLHFCRSECIHEVPAFCAPITKNDNSNPLSRPYFACLFLTLSCMDGKDGPGFLRARMLLLASDSGSGHGLFLVVDRGGCWVTVGELCGKVGGFDDEADTGAAVFDLNEASMEAKSLIFMEG